jgi:Arc/MetJ family transcription regulator
MIKKTSFNLDRRLVAQASAALGTRTMTETIHRALDEVVRHEELHRLAEWRPDLTLDDLERLRGGSSSMPQ